MAQYIKQGNIFGRIGSNIGRGLAEQIPKEVERNRLQSSLERVGENENLSPFQRFTGLVGAAHEYPQVVQSGSELLKQQAIRNSFRNPQGQQQQDQPQASAQTLTGQPNNPNMPAGQIDRSVIQGGENIPTNFATRAAEAAANQGIVRENPTQNKFLPIPPWTPAQRDADIERESQRHPELSFEQISARVADNERRQRESPEDYRKQQEYLTNVEDQADAEFDKQLETILQKKGNEIYGDLTGETLLDTKKAMKHDLSINAHMTPKQAAEKWVKKGKDFVDHKSQVRAIANRSFEDKLFPHKKDNNLRALKSAQKSYEEMGRQREFYDMLQSHNKPDGGYGFGLSPGAAALIAYPRSEPIKKLINSVNPNIIENKRLDVDKESRRIGDEFAKNRTNGDSILAFVKQMQTQFPKFNSKVFLDYLRENTKEFNFNPNQKKELDLPEADFFPNWGDIALFPYSGRSAVHD